ncbi:MAG: acetylglutamate kinase [Sphingobacteriales bacterium]|nr:MAG: acetylglutamate kinase [Sphingobacteriales bacterium]
MDNLLIIKIGGNIVDDATKLAAFLKDFVALPGAKILVHGGGKVATKIGAQLGIASKYVDGRRITDAATIDLVTMVYAGLINKKMVAALQSMGCNALGVTGADANLVPAIKRAVKEIDYGFVGDVKSEQLHTQTWQVLLNNGLVLIVAPITHDEQGQLLNTNADTMAQEIAKALSKFYNVSLLYSFEKAGVLLDVNDDASVVKQLGRDYYQQLKTEGKIFAGMIPKLDNAFAAIAAGVSRVIIGPAEALPALTNGTAGTTITNE